MNRDKKPLSRVKLLTALIAIAAPIWVAGQGSNEGEVKWLEPVTDQQYLAAPRK